jgi:hypothetical protein
MSVSLDMYIARKISQLAIYEYLPNTTKTLAKWQTVSLFGKIKVFILFVPHGERILQKQGIFMK